MSARRAASLRADALESPGRAHGPRLEGIEVDHLHVEGCGAPGDRGAMRPMPIAPKVAPRMRRTTGASSAMNPTHRSAFSRNS